jgi:hypothetical protein
MKTEYTPTIEKPFNGKTEYLAWREAWRKHYALLTEQIREQKLARKDKDPSVRSSAQCVCWMLRQEATALLEKRKQSKIEAQRQYLASKPVMAQ